MDRIGRNAGNVTPLVLVVITGLSLVAMSLFPLVVIAERRVAAGENEVRQRKDLDALLNSVLEALKDDDTPENDSPDDLIWMRLMEWEMEEFDIRLEDSSSRLGINWIRKEMLEKANFLSTSVPGDEFQQKRFDMKLPGNPDYLYEWLLPEDIKRYFSIYSYFNVNISDEFSLQQVYSQIMSSEASSGDRFRSAVQQSRIADNEGNVQYLDAEGLKEITGEDFNKIYPVINTLPAMNLHYTKNEIIELVVNFHGLNEEWASAIITEQSPDENTLKNLLGEDFEKSILPYYFGVKTWFWNFKAIHKDGLVLKAVIACVPVEDGSFEYRIIEKQYE